MSHTPSRRRVGRRAAILAQAALMMTSLIGIMAIGLDGGLMMMERRHAQETADAAALAAAAVLGRSGSINSATQRALAVAKLNGYANDGTYSVITPNTTGGSGKPVHGIFIPPVTTTSPFYNQSNCAEVIVQYNQKRGFSGLWASGTIPVYGRAIARAGAPSVWSASILTLSTTASPGLTISGGSTVTVPEAVVVDSSASTATNLNGNNSKLSAPLIEIVGGYSPSSGSGYTPNPVTGNQYYTPDPFTSLAPPDTSTLTVQSASAMSIKSGSVTLNPGIYQGGISVSNGAHVTLNPGIYYLEGGGLSVQNPGTTLSDGGAGVLIYNGETGGSTSNPSSVGTISVTAGAVVTISPMSSGTYQGISIFQDRNATTAMTLNGGGGTYISGMVYAPAAAVTATGGSSIIPGTAFISSTLNLTGGSSFALPLPPIFVPIPGASPTKASLVE